MAFRPLCLTVLLCPALLLFACGSTRQQRTARLLEHRLEDRLAPDIAAGRAVLQPIPGGARVTLLGASAAPNGKPAADDKSFASRASVVEGLLDPSLMRIAVTDTTTLPDSQREQRVRDVRHYFEDFGLGATLEPDSAIEVAQAGAVPAGLTITIGVVCPYRHDGAGYGSGRVKPACY